MYILYIFLFLSLTRQRIFSYLRYSFVTRHRSATIESVLFDRRYDRIAFLPSNRLIATSLLPACKHRETTLEIHRSKGTTVSTLIDETELHGGNPSLAVKFSHGRSFRLATLEFLLDVVVYVSTITFRVRSIEMLSQA